MRVLLAFSAMLSLSACGEPGTPSSLTTHMNGRINTTGGYVSTSH